MKTIIYDGIKYECKPVIWDDWQNDIYIEGTATTGLYKSKKGSFFLVRREYYSNGRQKEEYEKISIEQAINFLQRIHAPAWAYDDAGINYLSE